MKKEEKAKWSLIKTTIARLNRKEMNTIYGGISEDPETITKGGGNGGNAPSSADC